MLDIIYPRSHATSAKQLSEMDSVMDSCSVIDSCSEIDSCLARGAMWGAVMCFSFQKMLVQASFIVMLGRLFSMDIAR